MIELVRARSITLSMIVFPFSTARGSRRADRVSKKSYDERDLFLISRKFKLTSRVSVGFKSTLLTEERTMATKKKATKKKTATKKKATKKKKK
jgi:hypothetical protein